MFAAAATTSRPLLPSLATPLQLGRQTSACVHRHAHARQNGSGRRLDARSCIDVPSVEREHDKVGLLCGERHNLGNEKTSRAASHGRRSRPPRPRHATGIKRSSSFLAPFRGILARKMGGGVLSRLSSGPSTLLAGGERWRWLGRGVASAATTTAPDASADRAAAPPAPPAPPSPPGRRRRQRRQRASAASAGAPPAPPAPPPPPDTAGDAPRPRQILVDCGSAQRPGDGDGRDTATTQEEGKVVAAPLLVVPLHGVLTC